MGKLRGRRLGVAVTAVAVVAGVAGCGTEQGPGESRSATQVLRAAYEKTAEAKSAKFTMEMDTPGGLAGGSLKMTGVMGWDPAAMDMSVTGSPFAGAAGAPGEARMKMVDEAVYVDLGSQAPASLGGKRWLKLDLGAAAGMVPDKELAKLVTGGLEQLNENPAERLALLLDSPNVKKVGEERIDGVAAEHYKGTVSVQEMLTAEGVLEVLKPQERQKLLANLEKAGVQSYETEVWVNEDDLPVKTDVTMNTPQGEVGVVTTFSEYGAKAAVSAPPAGQTADLLQDLLKGTGIGEKLGQKARASAEGLGAVLS
ncbi:hypothetical protein ACFVIM_11790 [Streptomyces sp. NPDC057638]|uniref:hypothetical protein n=1 Tax=Streptomyces sp. NPDC057638 TaxID=3346190 RepID=UPI0036CF62BF